MENTAYTATQRRNEKVYITRSLSQSVANALCDGAYVTSFLLFIGLNTQQISTMNSALNAAMLCASVLVLFAFNWDKTGLSLLRICSFGCILMPGSLFLAGFVDARYAFLLLLVLRFISSLASSARNSAEINAVPMLFGRDRYSRLLGISGVVGGAFTLLISLGTMFLFRSLDEASTYRYFFGTSTFLMCIYAMLTQLYRRPAGAELQRAEHVSFRKVFMPQYLLKSIPHIVRGIGATGAAMFPLVVLPNVELTQMQNTLLIPLGIVAGIASSFLLTHMSRRIRPGTIVMIGFAISAAAYVAAPFIHTPLVFFVVYSILHVANTLGSKCTMASVVYACEKEDLSLMSSLHVLYYSIAYSPAVLVFGQYLDAHPLLIMSIAAAFYLAGGILFHFAFHKGVEQTA